MIENILEPESFETVMVLKLSDLAETLSQVEDFLRRFIVFPSKAHSPTIALWLAHSHTLAAFDDTPYLRVFSTENAAAKTGCPTRWPCLAPEPWVAVSRTDAVVCRTIATSQAVDTIFTGGKGESKGGAACADQFLDALILCEAKRLNQGPPPLSIKGAKWLQSYKPYGCLICGRCAERL
jgi:hypothetical protein